MSEAKEQKSSAEIKEKTKTSEKKQFKLIATEMKSMRYDSSSKSVNNAKIESKCLV